MLEFTLYPAEVIDNNDETKQGRVQIKIPHLMEETKAELLPWAKPFSNGGGGSTSTGMSFIPKTGSKLWVFFMDDMYYRECHYISDLQAKNMNIHTFFDDNIKSEVGAEGSYPNVKFIVFDNGICFAISDDPNSPEITLYHPKMYIFIDKNGYTYYKDTYDNKVKLDNTGLWIKDTKNNEIKSDGTKLVINNHFTVEQ